MTRRVLATRQIPVAVDQWVLVDQQILPALRPVPAVPLLVVQVLAAQRPAVLETPPRPERLLLARRRPRPQVERAARERAVPRRAVPRRADLVLTEPRPAEPGQVRLRRLDLVPRPVAPALSVQARPGQVLLVRAVLAPQVREPVRAARPSLALDLLAQVQGRRERSRCRSPPVLWVASSTEFSN